MQAIGAVDQRGSDQVLVDAAVRLGLGQLLQVNLKRLTGGVEGEPTDTEQTTTQ